MSQPQLEKETAVTSGLLAFVFALDVAISSDRNEVLLLTVGIKNEASGRREFIYS